jgi:hypothetical protein
MPFYAIIIKIVQIVSDFMQLLSNDMQLYQLLCIFSILSKIAFISLTFYTIALLIKKTIE